MAAVTSLLQAVRSNERFAQEQGRLQDFDHIEGLLALAQMQPDAALAAFDRGLERWPRPEIALRQAALLATDGRADLALRHLDTYAAHPQAPKRFGISAAQLHAWLLQRMEYWPNELQHMRETLAAAATQPQNAGQGSSAPVRDWIQ